jgi:long-chain fatty acid transport protein
VEDIPGPVVSAIFGGNRHFTSSMTTDMTLPSQITMAYKYQITPRWDVETDFGITGWSVFDRREFNFGTPNPVLTALSPINEGFHDVFSFSLGSDWDLNEYVTLRGGYFFFQGPARDGHFGPVIPDASKNSFSVGMGLNYKKITLDLMYHIEIYANRDIDETDAGNNVGVIAEGDYRSYLNLFSFNVTYRFGAGSDSEAPHRSIFKPSA